jgi:hypothetical protein
MSQPQWQRIIDHVDRDEIISKMSIDTPVEDIHAWLKGKYTLASDKKLLLSLRLLKSFKDNYFDFYQTLKNDFAKTKTALATNSMSELELAVQSNPSYKNALIGVLNEEIDLKATISRLAVAVETRLGQMYDVLQEMHRDDPRDIDTRLERVFIEYVNAFTPLLEKAHKIINEAPDQIVQHNITVQHIDQTISVFYEAIRKTLEKMDLESSMLFMEIFNETLQKLQDPNTTPPNRLAEVKALNSTINGVLNG